MNTNAPTDGQKTIEVEYRKVPEYKTRLHAADYLLDIGKALKQRSLKFERRATSILSLLGRILRITPRVVRWKVHNYVVAKIHTRQRTMLGPGYGHLFPASAVFSAFALKGFLDYCATNPTGQILVPKDLKDDRQRLAKLYRRYCLDVEPNWGEEPFIWFDDCLSLRSDNSVMRDRIVHPLPIHAPSHLRKTYTVAEEVDVQTFLTGKLKFEWEYDDVRASKLFEAVSKFIQQVTSNAGLPIQAEGFSATVK